MNFNIICYKLSCLLFYRKITLSAHSVTIRYFKKINVYLLNITANNDFNLYIDTVNICKYALYRYNSIKAIN